MSQAWVSHTHLIWSSQIGISCKTNLSLSLLTGGPKIPWNVNTEDSCKSESWWLIKSRCSLVILLTVCYYCICLLYKHTFESCILDRWYQTWDPIDNYISRICLFLLSGFQLLHLCSCTGFKKIYKHLFQRLQGMWLATICMLLLCKEIECEGSQGLS